MSSNMTPGEMKALVRRCMMDGFSANNLSVLNGLFHDNYKRNATVGLKSVNSFAEHVEDLKYRHLALTNAHFEIDDMIAEGDTVAARFTMVGEHTGDLYGIAATGKTIRRQQISFFRIIDRKIAESWNVTDMHGMLNELKGASADVS